MPPQSLKVLWEPEGRRNRLSIFKGLISQLLWLNHLLYCYHSFRAYIKGSGWKGVRRIFFFKLSLIRRLVVKKEKMETKILVCVFIFTHLFTVGIHFPTSVFTSKISYYMKDSKHIEMQSVCLHSFISEISQILAFCYLLQISFFQEAKIKLRLRLHSPL